MLSLRWKLVLAQAFAFGSAALVAVSVNLFTGAGGAWLTHKGAWIFLVIGTVAFVIQLIVSGYQTEDEILLGKFRTVGEGKLMQLVDEIGLEAAVAAHDLRMLDGVLNRVETALGSGNVQDYQQWKAEHDKLRARKP